MKKIVHSEDLFADGAREEGLGEAEAAVEGSL